MIDGRELNSSEKEAWAERFAICWHQGDIDEATAELVANNTVRMMR